MTENGIIVRGRFLLPDERGPIRLPHGQTQYRGATFAECAAEIARLRTEAEQGHALFWDTSDGERSFVDTSDILENYEADEIVEIDYGRTCGTRYHVMTHDAAGDELEEADFATKVEAEAWVAQRRHARGAA